MSTIVEQIEAARKVVDAYVKALNKLDVKPITFLIHPYFHFRYPSGYGAYGLSNDWRYLGYLYQTFAQMKKEGAKIHAERATLGESDYSHPCVMLRPPHDRRILFPNEKRYIESCKIDTPQLDVFFSVRVKDGMIFRMDGLLHPAEYSKLILKK